jgi:hypothetical protein
LAPASVLLIQRALLAVSLSATLALCFAADLPGASDRIQPYAKNPRYWQYKGGPVVLLGGSKDHNLFQIPDLEEHLKLLATAGGNYVRNTMSSRDPGDAQPFARLPDGRYDLERSNDEYWRRFDNLLRLARDLGIVVQIEVWDRFDYTGDQWETTAFNPKHNINYTYEKSGFAEKYPEHPGENKQPFFFTTPKQRNNTTVLRYQQRFVDQMLRYSLRYPNVLYCLDNETAADEAWGAYWADYIRSRGRAAGMRVFVTEMWDEWDLQSAQHRRTLDHPERYDFVDVSQNNHQRGEHHWSKFQWVRQYVETKPRPINTVKTYGADKDGTSTTQSTVQRVRSWIGRAPTADTPDDYGDTQQGTERWWRHLIGGAAAVRFHRPPSGIGLNAEAQQHIRSARMFLQEFNMVRAVPDAKHELLSNRSDNEAYLTYIGGEAYAVYFPNGGDVGLSISPAAEYALKWLDIAASRWSTDSPVRGDTNVRLKTPASGQWLALIRKKAASSATTSRPP